MQHLFYRTQTPASDVKGKNTELRKRGIIFAQRTHSCREVHRKYKDLFLLIPGRTEVSVSENSDLVGPG